MCRSLRCTGLTRFRLVLLEATERAKVRKQRPQEQLGIAGGGSVSLHRALASCVIDTRLSRNVMFERIPGYKSVHLYEGTR